MGTINCEAGKGYAVDTLTEEQTALLPATPDENDQVGFADYNRTFSSRALTIDGNGNLVAGQQTYGLATSGQFVTLTFISGEWIVTAGGVSPVTSVLNKPMFVVGHKPASGTAPQSLTGAATGTVATLSSVFVNEIPGAALANDTITLPAGRYHIDAIFPYCRTGSTVSGFHPSHVDMIDENDVAVISGYRLHDVAGYETNMQICRGIINISQSANFRFKSYCRDSSGDIGRAASLGTPENYGEVQVTSLDSVVDIPVISDPQMKLQTPLLHVQDQKPTGTPGGDAIAGENKRVLNTVLTNEIPGASLANDEITLAAGVYDVVAHSTVYRASTSTKGSRVSVWVDGSPVLVSPSTFVYQTEIQGNLFTARGRLTLTSESVVSVYTYHEAGFTAGLGYKTDQAPYEVFTDVQIRQLDAVVQTPVLVNDRLFPMPGNVKVTGNMHGLGYAKTGDNEITIDAGLCMDSLNETILTLSLPQVLNIPAVASEVYNLFLCDDGFVRHDTDPDGANLTGYKIRWIGFVINDSAGVLFDFYQDGDTMEYPQNNNYRETSMIVVSTTLLKVPFGDFVPVSRVEHANVVCNGTTAAALYMSFNGSTTPWIDYIQSGSYSPNPPQVSDLDNVWFKTSAGSAYICLFSVKMKR